MTLTEVATTIPGMLTIALFAPIICIVLIKILQDFAEWTADTINSFRHEPSEPATQPAHNGSNVISINTIEAMAHIKNHPAMRFVEKN